MVDDRVFRRRHVGPDPLASAIDLAVGLPPLPLPAHVAIVDNLGRPTTDYAQWQTDVHEWRLRLFKHLGGTVRPRPHPLSATERERTP